jgi:MoaA/NifB/PqqE/SkfB family radical SAM enzyme
MEECCCLPRAGIVHEKDCAGCAQREGRNLASNYTVAGLSFSLLEKTGEFMSDGTGKPGLRISQLLGAWRSILTGSTPMLSIEITRECPLSCPGCYAYGDTHLAGVLLRDLSDFRGDDLVRGIIRLVDEHRPLHVSLVGGEPLVRHRELSRLLPMLSERKIHTMIVTSAVIPIPTQWMEIPRVRVTVSVDGLPEHHDVRRKPATYEKILKTIVGCQINIHWTITRPMLERAGYIEEYLSFWSARQEVVRIWVSLYTPQRGEQCAEMLTSEDRQFVASELLRLKPRMPKLLMNQGLSRAIVNPPADPSQCMFARMSTNYSADLKTRVEPCIFGGDPDCSQCGCAISTGLHWVKEVRLAHIIKLEKIALSSAAIGSFLGKFQGRKHPRWTVQPRGELVQISNSQDRERKAS